MQHYFLTGVGTNIGKTISSSVWVQAFGYDYWKPVQCGDLIFSDTDRVKKLVSRTDIKFYEEAYRLRLPYSPYEAFHREFPQQLFSAYTDHQKSKDAPSVEKLLYYYEEKIKNYSSKLIIEGAGGIMVPLNKQETLLDFVMAGKFPVIVVVKHYLGNLNHTLLTMELFDKYQIPVKGIIFNGVEPEHHFALDYLKDKTGVPILGFIPEKVLIDAQEVSKLVEGMNNDEQ